MTDVHQPEIRRYNMSRIRSKNTKPEMAVRRFLHKHGFMFRLHVKDLTGKPDIVLPKYKKVIFVNGCFWHGHIGCRYFVEPKTRTKWWKEKIGKTKEKDTKIYKELEQNGWSVIIIWECELKTKNNNRLVSLLNEIKK
jgi:DNA mismatch endonuclease (patch repair protein)